MNTNTLITRPLTIGALALLPLSLAACADSGAGENAPAPTGTTAEEATTGIAFEGPWAKAADGMSGVFGTIVNDTTEDITLVEASSPRAGLVELHETAMVDGQMVMREIEGGFDIPAGARFELVPGEDHIMLMELDSELLAGEVLPLTLTFSDGESMSIDIDVREYAGADENYGDLEHHDHEENDSGGNDRVDDEAEQHG